MKTCFNRENSRDEIMRDFTRSSAHQNHEYVVGSDFIQLNGHQNHQEIAKYTWTDMLLEPK